MNCVFVFPTRVGWTALAGHEARVALVFPTRVGMDRRRMSSMPFSAGIPHTRGDGPM